MTNKIQFDRLLKLANHLEKGKLGHRKFDFSVINTASNKCGSAGCALGECPIVFPDDWKFKHKCVELKDSFLNTKSYFGHSSFEYAEIYFGLTDDQSNHLFNPDQQDTRRFGGVELNGASSKTAVARNIRTFVKKFRK